MAFSIVLCDFPEKNGVHHPYTSFIKHLAMKAHIRTLINP